MRPFSQDIARPARDRTVKPSRMAGEQLPCSVTDVLCGTPIDCLSRAVSHGVTSTVGDWLCSVVSTRLRRAVSDWIFDTISDWLCKAVSDWLGRAAVSDRRTVSDWLLHAISTWLCHAVSDWLCNFISRWLCLTVMINWLGWRLLRCALGTLGTSMTFETLRQTGRMQHNIQT